MTLEELAIFNGKNGQPAYVAVGSIVYDLSKSTLWPDGLHEGTHQAGCDLSEALRHAPHVAAVVQRFPRVGQLEMPAPKTGKVTAKLIWGGILLGLLFAWIFLP
jgi:predicted heme/steroid binding protein